MQPGAEDEPGRAARWRSSLEGVTGRATDWFDQRRAERVPWDLAGRFYERDRQAFASVLGAAIALRLFLFVVASSVAFVGLLLVVFGASAIDNLLDASEVGGGLAGQLSGAAHRGRSSGWGMLLGGVWLSVLGARNLTAVLAACSASAWGLGAHQARTTMRMVAGVCGLVVVVAVSSGLINRLRAVAGLGVDAASIVVAAVAFGVAWFVVCWSLPRGTRDPGALLPGAVMVGVAMAALQWFMQLYLPGRIARSSEVMGSLGFSVAVLGYMFLLGRLMAASLILNAVVHERLGSISSLVFSLPLLRRIPERSEKVTRFFDL